jgi:hypothetical protein
MAVTGRMVPVGDGEYHYRCGKCKQAKPIEDFYIRPGTKQRPGEVSSYCRACQRAYVKEYAKTRESKRPRRKDPVTGTWVKPEKAWRPTLNIKDERLRLVAENKAHELQMSVSTLASLVFSHWLGGNLQLKPEVAEKMAKEQQAEELKFEVERRTWDRRSQVRRAAVERRKWRREVGLVTAEDFRGLAGLPQVKEEAPQE